VGGTPTSAGEQSRIRDRPLRPYPHQKAKKASFWGEREDSRVLFGVRGGALPWALGPPNVGMAFYWQSIVRCSAGLPEGFTAVTRLAQGATSPKITDAVSTFASRITDFQPNGGSTTCSGIRPVRSEVCMARPHRMGVGAMGGMLVTAGVGVQETRPHTVVATLVVGWRHPRPSGWTTRHDGDAVTGRLRLARRIWIAVSAANG